MPNPARDLEIAENRPLSDKEAELVRWLLENGTEASINYLSQIDKAWVVSRCGCGCASIDFSIDGTPPDKKAGMDVLSDHCWETGGQNLCGVFLFARDKKLAGLEVWSIDGMVSAPQLPDPDELRPFPN